METEKDLARKLLDAIRATQPNIIKEDNQLNITWQGQTISLPILLNQVTGESSISFR